VDEKEMLFLNQKYLNHNTHTDIITFDYSEKNVINGELFICIDRVKENAAKFENNNFRKESLRVIIHGILHLCGYKDKKAKDKKIMKQKEDDYLNIFESMN
jgi:rRNA maturation RNase YbeY